MSRTGPETEKKIRKPTVPVRFLKPWAPDRPRPSRPNRWRPSWRRTLAWAASPSRQVADPDHTATPPRSCISRILGVFVIGKWDD